MHLSELKNQFLDFLQQRCSGPKHEKLGVEYETFVMWGDAAQLKPLPIEGDPSIYKMLQRMLALSQKAEHPWEAQYEDSLLLGLVNQAGQSISVEPGGQIELSDAPRTDLTEVAHALGRHLEQLLEASRSAEGHMLFLGVHPLLTPEQLPLLPKQRYRLMYETMQRVDTHGQWMMKATSGVQVNLDYQSLEDLERKFVLLNRLTPFLTAIFANSPIVEGQDSGYRSFRGRIWQNTDPHRAGLPQAFVAKNFTLADYIEWALDVAPYHLYREGKVVTLGDQTFRALLRDPSPLELNSADWMLHLGMLFPDVRIKRIMEVRCIDTQLPRDVMAVPALLQALVYNEDAIARLESWLMDLPEEAFAHYRNAAAKDGIAAEVGEVSFAKAAIKILETTLEQMDSETQLHWLVPFFERYTKHGQCPADQILERFHAASSLTDWLERELANSSLTALYAA
jgi:glutamate--cysteine ligase